ncbi:MAG: TolC family protein [Candidatus Stahlbacteria bacterium]|nr:TolC family protein [Candidatus Stahlbacteria bacterium]
MILLIGLLSLADTLYLTLSKSIEIALGQNKSLLSAQEYLNAAKSTLTASKCEIGNRSGLIPSITLSNSENSGKLSISSSQTLPTGGYLDLYTNLGQSGFTIRSPKKNNIEYRISFSQPLFTDNLTKFAVQESKFNMLCQEANYDVAKRDLLFSVIEGFYGVIKAEESIKVQEEVVKRANALVELSNAQFTKGLAIDVDLLEAQIYLSMVEIALSHAKINLYYAKEQFSALLYLEPSQEFNLSYELSIKPSQVDLPALTDSAIKTYPFIKKITHEIELAKLDIKKAKRGFDYNLILTGNYGKSGFDSSFKFNFQSLEESWSVGAQINLPLSDNRITLNKVKSAMHNLKALELIKDKTKRELEMQINQEVVCLTEFYNQYKLLQTATEYAKSNVRFSEVKFKEGLIRGEVVIRAQDYFTTTQLTLVNSIVNYTLSQAKLYYLTGASYF